MKEGKLPRSKPLNKNVSIAMGRNDDKHWNSKLRDIIINGAETQSDRQSPSFVRSSACGIREI